MSESFIIIEFLNLPVGRSSKLLPPSDEDEPQLPPSLDRFAVGIPKSELPLPKPRTTVLIIRMGMLLLLEEGGGCCSWGDLVVSEAAGTPASAVVGEVIFLETNSTSSLLCVLIYRWNDEGFSGLKLSYDNTSGLREGRKSSSFVIGRREMTATHS